MATIVEMINPLTGLPEQVDKLDHTAQEIDDAVTRTFKVSARNFLRNWYFVNPVNQRGVSGTISTTGYFIDGWKLVSGTVQITSTGLVLNGTIEQILESGIGQPVKATFLASDGVFDASYNDSTKTFTITATGKTLIAAKLELGSQQTLAHQDADGNRVLNEIPDYGEQLARCQRYFYKTHYAQYQTINIAFEGTTYSFLALPIPVCMRTDKPVLTQSVPISVGNSTKIMTYAEVKGGMAILGVNYATTETYAGACYSYCPTVDGVTFTLSADL